MATNNNDGFYAINTDARYMVWLLDYLSSRGLDAQALAQRHHINADQLHQSTGRISEEQHRGLLLDALHESHDSGLGLSLGLHRSMATLDQLAYLMMSSATLRESTKQGLRYQNYPGRFSGHMVITSFSEIQQQGCYQIEAKQQLGELRLLAVEDLLATIITTYRWVSGKNLPLTQLRCGYPAPPHADRYQAIFQCPVQFDAPSTQLFFDATILDEPLPNASPQSAALYAKLCEETSISRNQGDIAWRVWQIIVDNPAEPPTLEQCAHQLHVSPRTLSRKLQAQDWQYQQLLDQVREIHARRYLSNPLLSITDIGHKLGYADSSGFHRAFKKWTGLAPGEFRDSLFS